MEVISLSEFNGASFGQVLAALPTSPGSIVSLTPRPPFVAVNAQASDDVAWIEWMDGRHVVTPAKLPTSAASFGEREVCFVNGLALRRPIDLWPGSRLALMLSKVLLFVRPDPETEAGLPAAVQGAALAAHLSLVRKRILMVHHLDQQALRIMRADQQLARFEREADTSGKQAAALELKQSNAVKKLAGLRAQGELVQANIAGERSGANDDTVLREHKSQLKGLKTQMSSLELLGMDLEAEAERSRREEAKLRGEWGRVLAVKVELKNRVREVERWLRLLGPPMRYTLEHAGPGAKESLPDNATVLSEYLPPPEPDALDAEDVDERPIVDAMLSDPKSFEVHVAFSF